MSERSKAEKLAVDALTRIKEMTWDEMENGDARDVAEEVLVQVDLARMNEPASTPDATHLHEVNAALVEALREAQSALALMVSPDAIRQSTVSHAFAQATAAEAKARAALALATGEQA